MLKVFPPYRYLNMLLFVSNKVYSEYKINLNQLKAQLYVD